MIRSIADSYLFFISTEAKKDKYCVPPFQKWHPDKKKEETATSRFQEINEAYKGKF